jgi:hypothetical protein
MKEINHGGHGGKEAANRLNSTAIPTREPVCITAVIAVIAVIAVVQFQLSIA